MAKIIFILIGLLFLAACSPQQPQEQKQYPVGGGDGQASITGGTARRHG